MNQGSVDIVSGLRAEILRMEGFKPSGHGATDIGLGPMLASFPNGTFPTGAVHEFLASTQEELAPTSGFITSLLGTLMGTKGTVVWISTHRSLFPPALKTFGVEPDRFIFIDLKKESDVLWAMDEALKCAALTAVVGETPAISFTESRRLQLAVEQSQVTGFIIRKKTQHVGTTACVSRWKISTLPCDSFDDLPGIGFPKWRAELLRMRNGKPGQWDINCINGRFEFLEALAPVAMPIHEQRRAG